MFIIKRLTLAGLVTLAAFFCGCSSLLYHPTRAYRIEAKQISVSPPQEVTFKNEEGVLLSGWYFHTHKKPKGMIVFFHGNAENISTHFASLHWVLNEGYDYFVFDYEGYGRSQGKPSPRATISDGRAAIHWAFQKNPRLPLIILGQSLGGAVALQTVISLKNDTPKDDVPIALVTVDSTFLSYRKVARSVLAQHALTWIFQPLTTLVLSDRYAPGDRVCNISPIPLLVFHGDHDQTVPYSLGKEVYQKAKEPKEFITIPEGHHIDLFWREGGRYRREWIRRLKEILDRKALF